MLMCCLSCAKVDWCKQADRVEDYCVDHEERPMTNADRIRQMSDEGIEDWYWWMHKEMMRYTDSRVFVHDWLKAPVEQEDCNG